LLGRPPASEENISGRKVFLDPIEAISTVALPWISICESTHEMCRHPKQPQLPTRVLKVGLEGEGVMLTGSQGLDGPYTILSYCWGQGVSLKTTPLTLAARLHREIPYDHLPLTLRHAVKVTRQLRVKYLWVDALCIIQDQFPPTDWLAESGKMLDYYRNAYVTIGNLDGEASSSGFLFPRKYTSVNIPGHEEISVRLQSARQRSSIYTQSVLHTRAWCLQERLMSTRLLLFGEDQIFWECRTCCEREATVDTGIKILEYGVLFQGRRTEDLDHDMLRIMASLGTDGISLREYMNIWYSIVEQYTSQRLTRATDILIAISGVATEIQRRTGHDYICGLWRQDWCKGLAWTRRPGGQVTGAPSWSWASKTGVVDFKVLQRSQDSNFNTTFEDQIEFLKTCNNGRELYIRAKCRQLAPRLLRINNALKSNTFPLWSDRDDPYSDGWVELDGDANNLTKTCRALNTLLRYSYTIETGPDSELLLSGFFTVSYLVLSPDETLDGKWKRIGLGVNERRIIHRKISFEDLGSEDVFRKLRPKLLFDDDDYEDICLI
jgi:hypothetical protein